MFAVLLMMAVLLITTVRFVVHDNQKHVPKGEFIFDRFDYFVFALFIPAGSIVLFVIEAIENTLGVREAVGSYAYWLVGGLLLLVFTVIMHKVIQLRRS